jgi:hypothetical protein
MHIAVTFEMSFWDGPLQITIELRDAAGVDWQRKVSWESYASRR